MDIFTRALVVIAITSTWKSRKTSPALLLATCLLTNKKENNMYLKDGKLLSPKVKTWLELIFLALLVGVILGSCI